MIVPWFETAIEVLVLAINVMAAVFIVFGAVRAFVAGMRVMTTAPNLHDRREVWFAFARALIAGLTFQLAADILETSIHTDWESIGKLGAVAVIRTFLNYFLERDLREARRTELPAP
jgi:uncharacterized membrane protein